MFLNKNTLTSYDDYTKAALVRLLEEKEQGLIYINREITQSKEIISGYFNSIAKQKELYKKTYQEWCSVDSLKWKVLITEKTIELNNLKDIKNDLERRVEEIKDSLETYDMRYNKKFGRKSPFMQIDFGYDIGLSR